MRTRIMVALGAVTLLAAMAVPAIAANTAATNATSLVATLHGGAEVPPVATKVAGLARITIDLDKRIICYDLLTTGKRRPVAAHIHEGIAGANGGVVVDFGTFGQAIGRQSEGCTRSIPKSTLEAIAAAPSNYYVNVHTAANTSGEVRGQLAVD